LRYQFRAPGLDGNENGVGRFQVERQGGHGTRAKDYVEDELRKYLFDQGIDDGAAEAAGDAEYSPDATCAGPWNSRAAGAVVLYRRVKSEIRKLSEV